MALNNQPLVVAFGGGVNSTAMLVGMVERDICLDLILFADTGGEKPETYKHVEFMSNWALQRFGIPISIVRASQRTDATLEANILRLKLLPSIAYGYRTCSQRWKLEPCLKYLNHWKPAQEAWARGERIINAKGIDAGESHRAGEYSDKKIIVTYPLIDWHWTRRDCVDAIRRFGLPMPVKSACFFCPSSKKREILALKAAHPDLYERAIAIERNAESGLTNIKGLGRHWSWEELGSADEGQMRLFTELPSLECTNCYDG